MLLELSGTQLVKCIVYSFKKSGESGQHFQQRYGNRMLSDKRNCCSLVKSCSRSQVEVRRFYLEVRGIVPQ